MPDRRLLQFLIERISNGSHMLLVLLTGVLADVNYRWVEMPLRLRGNALAARLFGEQRTAD
jgi:hypothetical protein